MKTYDENDDSKSVTILKISAIIRRVLLYFVFFIYCRFFLGSSFPLSLCLSSASFISNQLSPSPGTRPHKDPEKRREENGRTKEKKINAQERKYRRERWFEAGRRSLRPQRHWSVVRRMPELRHRRWGGKYATKRTLFVLPSFFLAFRYAFPFPSLFVGFFVPLRYRSLTLFHNLGTVCVCHYILLRVRCGKE